MSKQEDRRLLEDALPRCLSGEEQFVLSLVYGLDSANDRLPADLAPPTAADRLAIWARDLKAADPHLVVMRAREVYERRSNQRPKRVIDGEGPLRQVEVATIIGCTEPRLSQVLSRARAKLRRHLDSERPKVSTVHADRRRKPVARQAG